MIKKILVSVVISMMAVGCIVIKNEKPNDIPENVLVANTQNVYRTSTNIIIKAMVQDLKSGEWVDAKYPVLIPAGYYIGRGL